MRIDINLASQPYEDARQFWMRWGTGVGALALLTLLLLALDVTGWITARNDRLAMARQRSMISDRDRVRADAEKVLNLPENRTTRDKSQFLNQLIERKAFSWTRVLENLEKVMPPRVHVVSISPQLNEDNELALKMTVAGESRDRAIELARRMEASHRFAQTQIIREATYQSQTGDNEQVELSAIYIPEGVADLTATPAATQAGAKATASETTNPSGQAQKKPSAKGVKH